jgi:DNA adenine methylase
VKYSKPYLKWAGGKGRLLGEILAALPDSISSFWDLTVGGGALPLRLHEMGRLTGNVVLNDAMPDLITLHSMTETCAETLQSVKDWPHTKEAFYAIRNRDLGCPDTALRILYANRRGYNGLIRHNRQGKLSTTWGGDLSSKGRPIQFWPKDMSDRIAAFGRLVSRSRLVCASMFDRGFDPAPGTWIYVDPPYPSTSPTATFKEYSTAFDWPEHERLAERAKHWARSGAHVLISNADLPRIREMYCGSFVKSISATRTIGAPSDSISKSQELLILVRG